MRIRPHVSDLYEKRNEQSNIPTPGNKCCEFGSDMRLPPASVRYRAVSMELAAYLDARDVEMHILTDTAQTIAIVCPRDSIFAVQRHIEQIGEACPEIATWSDQYRATPNRIAPPLQSTITR